MPCLVRAWQSGSFGAYRVQNLLRSFCATQVILSYTYRYYTILSCINVFQSPTGYYELNACVRVHRHRHVGTWIKGKDGVTQGCVSSFANEKSSGVQKGAYRDGVKREETRQG